MGVGYGHGGKGFGVRVVSYLIGTTRAHEIMLCIVDNNRHSLKPHIWTFFCKRKLIRLKRSVQRDQYISLTSEI